MANYLVTGAAGFIGARLAEVLLLQSHTITGVDNLSELIRILEKMIGKKALVKQLPANPADIRASLANIEKAKRILGWQPEVGLEDGIGRLVDWFNAERSWAKEVVKP